MIRSTGIPVRLLILTVVGATLAGCRWTSDQLLLRTDFSVRPFEQGYYAVREDDDDRPEIGYFEAAPNGWYRLAEDIEQTPDDTYLLLEMLDASGASNAYIGAWADESCFDGVCKPGSDFTYVMITFDGRALTSYMPDCNKEESGAFSRDRSAALQEGKAKPRAEGSRDVCVFDDREGLFGAMRDVLTRYREGSLTDVSHMRLQKID